MIDITERFSDVYDPESLLIIRKRQQGEKVDRYIEYYPLDEQGVAQAGHPLTLLEARKLSRALLVGDQTAHDLLTPAGLLPANVIYLASAADPTVFWHTPVMKEKLFFIPDLGIPSGNASIPSLLWMATPGELRIFALVAKSPPMLTTQLQLAPFFNIHNDGKVCMGNVALNFPPDSHLEDFISAWQKYFFESKFSHMIAHESPVKTNIVDLWKSLVGTGRPFPINQLKPSPFTLQNLIP
jgi:PRTRC genetic system protein B